MEQYSHINNTGQFEWLFLDNGFTSLERMLSCHEKLAQAILGEILDQQQPMSVVDLGCGNGALLKRIYTANRLIVPYGIELSHRKIANARILNPEFSGNFWVGDIFSGGSLRYLPSKIDIALLMLGRFLDVSATISNNLISFIIEHVHKLIIYAYGDTGGLTDVLIVLAKAANLAIDRLLYSDDQVAAAVIDYPFIGGKNATPRLNTC
jgi:SAM-dependent methyltransferase